MCIHLICLRWEHDDDICRIFSNQAVVVDAVHLAVQLIGRQFKTEDATELFWVLAFIIYMTCI